ncbi:MAG: arginine deiminase-related protein [Flavobacteriaceae bacterium]|nr:arginine deiminase-related protein [Flavobacteriaceae bacterium]
MRQITDTILMVRPVNFRMNEQTAVNNYYQKVLADVTPETVQSMALKEFDEFVRKLRSAGIQVIVFQDTKNPDTPDSIFPNNWISFHENGDVVLYPMFAENRRLERDERVLDLLEKEGFIIRNIIDYTSAEIENVFLEGTGSLILDRQHSKAYCALSPRADEDLLIEFCEDFDYEPVIFHANQSVNGERLAIYHTNVMMCLGEKFSIICLNSIDDKSERKNIVKHLKSDGKEVIDITQEQLGSFAGNMLQVVNNKGKKFVIMSLAALESLNEKQIKSIEKHGEIISSSLDTIEACGGGSARCMMAEVFLPKT